MNDNIFTKEISEDCKTLYVACDKVELTKDGYNVAMTLPKEAIEKVNKITLNNVSFINEKAKGKVPTNRLEGKIANALTILFSELALTLIATLAVLACAVKYGNDALGYASFGLIGALAMILLPSIYLAIAVGGEEKGEKK